MCDVPYCLRFYGGGLVTVDLYLCYEPDFRPPLALSAVLPSN